MALVFKIKFQNTLRRLLVSDLPESAPPSLLTVQDLRDKIRHMFSIPASDPLVITYVDTENDVITLADDQDLVDACLVQRLNPLRLLVEVRNELPKPSAQPSATSPEPAQDGNLETFLKTGFPQATADAIKRFLSWYTDVVDPRLSAAALLRNAQEAFNEFLETLTRQGAHDGSQAAPFPCENAARDAFKHLHHPCHPHDAQGFPFRGKVGKAGPSQVFHRGVQCDGCGMSPIEGPRFKSTKMVNYDLCAACFDANGNEADYQKMELPAYTPPHGCYRPPFPMRGGRQFMGPPGPRCPFLNGANFSSPGEVGKKLDARFVKDVTIFDGTELAPGTKFTKIWCLRNSGAIPWPQNTQLVHIGGDALSSEGVVNVELPEGGLPCGDDIEASVDLTAPEKAGRYVSHWRLMSPSGQKFGHKIWVMIQVVPHGEQSPQLEESLIGGEVTEEGEEAMVPGTEKEKEVVVSDTAENHDTSAPENIDMEEINMKAGEQAKTTDGSNAVADSTTHGKILLAAEKEQSEKHSNSLSRELDGFSIVEKPTENAEWLTISHSGAVETKLESSPHEQAVLQVQEQYTETGSLEILKTNHELQLQLLESMGFKEWDLNAFLIEKNNQNFQQTLDDLVALAGWADLLKDLQEMGFDDNHTNRQLLIKNKGSIKRVVKDLVEMEKQKVGVKDKVV